MICEALCLFRLKYHVENYLASCSQTKRLMICLRIECFALYKMVIFTLKKYLLLLILLMVVIQSINNVLMNYRHRSLSCPKMEVRYQGLYF